MRIRVYIANQDSKARVRGLEELLATYVNAATVTRGRGLFEGEWEASTIIEVLSHEVGPWVGLVAIYARALGEDSILVTVEGTDGILPYLVYESREKPGFVRWERI